MGSALEQLYHEDIITLAAGDNKPEFEYNREVFERAADWVYERGGFTPEMLKEQPALDVLNETFRVLCGAVSSSITEEVPEELVDALENNTFVFSGFKTYHSLSEVGLSLKDEKWGIKPFEEFQRDVKKIDAKYNNNYLYAEYNHAVTSSQMAAKWHDWEANGDRYDLQYRTAGDEHVRAAHQALHNITLPPSDTFWASYLPPNGWNCRCTAVQVMRGKYPTSDSAKAVEIGDEITADPKAQMFRFNPGKELKIYPDKHPYNKVPETAKSIINQLADEIKTPEQAVDCINQSPKCKVWFERGFKTLKSTSMRRVNGYTDLNGLIALKQSRLKNVLSGMTKLRRDKKITGSEADALATFWHEITHNRNKPGRELLTIQATDYMELANEFVARKTLPEFYEALGGKMQHPEFMDNRDSSGYNSWVRNYCKLIEVSGSNPDGVLNNVREHLFNRRYSEQAEGLINALKNNGATKSDGTKLEEVELKGLVKKCLLYREDIYENELKQLLIV